MKKTIKKQIKKTNKRKNKSKVNKLTPRKLKNKELEVESPNIRLEIEEPNNNNNNHNNHNNNNNKNKNKKVVMYSRNSKTGYETVMEAEKKEKDGMKSFVIKSESVLPPTIITHTAPNFSSTSMLTMAQKRQMVVKSFQS